MKEDTNENEKASACILGGRVGFCRRRAAMRLGASLYCFLREDTDHHYEAVIKDCIGTLLCTIVQEISSSEIYFGSSFHLD